MKRPTAIRWLIVLTMSFAVLLVWQLTGGSTSNAERNLLVAMQSADGRLLGIGIADMAHAFTRLGDWEVMTSVAVISTLALFLAGAKRGAGIAIVGYIATPLIVWSIKGWVARPRPLPELYASHGADAFSFPSGHSANSFVILGFLAFLVLRGRPPVTRAWGSAIAVIAVAVVGLSRIYLGAHWPTDVLAGWGVGACILVAMIWAQPAAVRTGRMSTLPLAALGLAIAIWIGAMTLHHTTPNYGAIDSTVDMEMRKVGD